MGVEYVYLVIAFLVGVVLLVFWAAELAELMTLEDAYFPGRYDKILWVVAFVIGNVVAALAFWLWKRAMLEIKQVERLQRERKRVAQKTGLGG